MSQKQKDLTVFIGRFNPFHDGHAEVLLNALKNSKSVLVLIGSAHQARTPKNPFSYRERSEMITEWYDALPNAIRNASIMLIGDLVDHPYSDAAWIREVQDRVETAKNDLIDIIGINPEVYLTGAGRDESTWYLRAFGDFFKLDLVEPIGVSPDKPIGLSATEVRKIMFESGAVPTAGLPTQSQDVIQKFIGTTQYNTLLDEYRFIQRYHEAWSVAPYAPTFVTVDACVIQSGYVLVNLRDNMPGRGLYCLPGGFLEQNERLVDGAVRELREETSIELSPAQLYGSIRTKEIFDAPSRSLRGRTITVCYLFKLDDTKTLPKVKPQKGEAIRVKWIPISEALSHPEMWFEDHHSLLSTMVGRLGAIS